MLSQYEMLNTFSKQRHGNVTFQNVGRLKSLKGWCSFFSGRLLQQQQRQVFLDQFWFEALCQSANHWVRVIEQWGRDTKTTWDCICVTLTALVCFYHLNLFLPLSSGCVCHPALHPPRSWWRGPPAQATATPAACSSPPPPPPPPPPPAAATPLAPPAARSAASMTTTARPPAWWEAPSPRLALASTPQPAGASLWTRSTWRASSSVWATRPTRWEKLFKHF